MEDKILQELQEIKKELQGIRSTLEPKEINLVSNIHCTEADCNNLVKKDCKHINICRAQ